MQRSNEGEEVWQEAKRVCDALSADQDELTRELVSRCSDRWSLWTMAVLAEAGGPMRFSRVMEQVEGISQKSLTKTLRALERDGLITRKVFAEVPPRVEYTIAPVGLEMLKQVEPLWRWVAQSVGMFEQTRTAYDRRNEAKKGRSDVMSAPAAQTLGGANAHSIRE